MSLAESSVASSSSTERVEGKQEGKHIVFPSSFLILPPTAASLGIVIGMYRGGRRARLRFIAENAHRQPTTYQGWYFYSKTRNYKIFYEAAKSGGRTALGLGTATAAYVFLDEYISYLREEILGQVTPRRDAGDGFRATVTWRKGGSAWWDGALAGTILGASVGLLWRLPRKLVGRCMALGGVMGGIHSYSRLASARLAERIRADQKLKGKKTAQDGKTAQDEKTAKDEMGQQEQGVVEDTRRQAKEPKQVEPQQVIEQDPEPRPPSALPDIDELLAPQPEASWWSSATSWFKGK